jgi:hypothetical protein
MKRFLLILVPFLALSCERAPKPVARPKIESVSDIKSPTHAPPPVQANSYDDGYKAGDLAGAAAAKTQKVTFPKKKPALPAAEALDVLALEAAGSDVARGQKWQRGYVAGFNDGFLREAEGKR